MSKSRSRSSKKPRRSAPKRAKRSRTDVTESEKKVIRRMTKAGATMRQIAKKIGRVPSTIWRWQNRKD